jgi:hypothetical protein
VKGAQFAIFQNSRAVAVGRNGEFDGLRSQVSQYVLEGWMHSVLASPEIY